MLWDYILIACLGAVGFIGLYTATHSSSAG